MTFSIVGRSADGQSLGVAVASKFLAVGAVVPAAVSGVGALATQAFANLAFREQGLALLRTGTAAADVIAGLVAADPGRAQRQVGVVAPTGPGASYTGPECFAWAGGVTGDGYAIQGNILTGPEVVAEMERAWLAGSALSLPRRLHAALAAGDAAGGDSRGRQSAALYSVRHGAGYGGATDTEIDLRVDDDPDPVGRMSQLISLWELYFTKPDPTTLLPLVDDLAHEVHERVTALGYTSLAAWAGVENLEERLADGAIDPLVLEQLRAAKPKP
ncbi:DUF1028 domain-containing protein [Dactylosporangium vinaceum]|uniref:DUF1028 domain-containing protein n=1 Tax=Dactylosporangium vinaceum TaxID=53362 RepID=A0ABV5MB68_9ACTN|nr:DUF1028 domain-containing protein [Dactylosporangium vinaceum]UAB98345.1 DUF1028 domain-containing protein [Dactylosporangium vinaceum]